MFWKSKQVLFFFSQGRLELELVSSHLANLWCAERITFLPSSGDLVVFGRVNKGEDPTLFVFLQKDGHLERRRLTKPCTPLPENILGLTIEGEDFIAVACPQYCDIKLFNPNTDEVIIAYKSNHQPERLCAGEPNRVWALTKAKPYHIIELNSEKKEIVETGKTTQAHELCDFLAYLPGSSPTMVFSTKTQVWAVSCKTNAVLWRVGGEVAGRLFVPKAVSECFGLLLAADYRNSRFVVLNAIGTTVKLPGGVGKPLDVCWSKDQLAVLSFWYQGQVGHHKLSFFRVSCNQQKSGLQTKGETELNVFPFRSTFIETELLPAVETLQREPWTQWKGFPFQEKTSIPLPFPPSATPEKSWRKKENPKCTHFLKMFSGTFGRTLHDSVKNELNSSLFSCSLFWISSAPIRTFVVYNFFSLLSYPYIYYSAKFLSERFSTTFVGLIAIQTDDKCSMMI